MGSQHARRLSHTNDPSIYQHLPSYIFSQKYSKYQELFAQVLFSISFNRKVLAYFHSSKNNCNVITDIILKVYGGSLYIYVKCLKIQFFLVTLKFRTSSVYATPAIYICI